jgi:GNAT superfamily N-acetyltransferase
MLKAPEPLPDQHKIDTFHSGIASLDEWLKRRAAPNQLSGASRTFVARDDDRVVGYYALASSAVAAAATRGRFRRNMPDPIPVVILARLAIARSHQGRGLGRALFQDAAKRVIHAADSIGIRGLLVHAISEEAKSFYLKLGLEVSPLEPMTLMATLPDLRSAL